MDFFWTYVCTFLLIFVGVILMFIVLLQRGRGGGLAGAFGGLGGQSAFGTKAGDVFTKITVVLATVWVILAGVTGFAMRHDAAQGFKGAKKEKSVSKHNGDDNNALSAKTKKPKEPKGNSESGNKTETKKKPDTPPKKDKEKKESASNDKIKSTPNEKPKKDPKKKKKD